MFYLKIESNQFFSLIVTVTNIYVTQIQMILSLAIHDLYFKQFRIIKLNLINICICVVYKFYLLYISFNKYIDIKTNKTDVLGCNKRSGRETVNVQVCI